MYTKVMERTAALIEGESLINSKCHRERERMVLWANESHRRKIAIAYVSAHWHKMEGEKKEGNNSTWAESWSKVFRTASAERNQIN